MKFNRELFTVVLALVASRPALARSIHILDRPAVARCVAHLFAGKDAPSDDPADAKQLLTWLALDRTEPGDEIGDEDNPLFDLLPKAEEITGEINRLSGVRLRGILRELESPRALKVVHVRRGPGDITAFLNHVSALSSSVDQKFRTANVHKFGWRESLVKGASWLAAVGVGSLAHRHGLTSSTVFALTTSIPGAAVASTWITRRAKYVARVAGTGRPPADPRRVKFEDLVKRLRAHLDDPPSEVPALLHFGTHHVFTPEFAQALRAADSVDRLSVDVVRDFARSRRHPIHAYWRNALGVQLGSIDYVFRAATPEEPARLVTITRLRRLIEVEGSDPSKRKDAKFESTEPDKLPAGA